MNRRGMFGIGAFFLVMGIAAASAQSGGARVPPPPLVSDEELERFRAIERDHIGDELRESNRVMIPNRCSRGGCWR